MISAKQHLYDFGWTVVCYEARHDLTFAYSWIAFIYVRATPRKDSKRTWEQLNIRFQGKTEEEARAKAVLHFNTLLDESVKQAENEGQAGRRYEFPEVPEFFAALGSLAESMRKLTDTICATDDVTFARAFALRSMKAETNGSEKE